MTREIEGGQAVVEVPLPAVFSAQKGLNEPRYASLPGIMKAKKKPIDEKTVADYGVDAAPRLTILKTADPAARGAGVKVASVAELASKLKNEMVVI